jgi:hypothetical protein
VVGSVEKLNPGVMPRGDVRPGAESSAPAAAHPLADPASPLVTVDGTVNYVPVGSVDSGRGVDHIAMVDDAGAPEHGGGSNAASDHTSIDHAAALGLSADGTGAVQSVAWDGSTPAASADPIATGNAHRLDALLGPSSVDGIAVRSLGDFDHNHSNAFGGPATGWASDNNGPNHSTALPTEIAFNHPHPLPALDISGGGQSAAAQIAYDQAWLNDMQANLAEGLSDGTSVTGKWNGIATPALGTLPTPTDLSPTAVTENASPLWNVHAPASHSINSATPVELGGGGAAGSDFGFAEGLVGYSGTFNLTIGGTGLATLDPSGALNGAQLVTVSLASPPALGDTLAGAPTQTTFVLDAGETNGTIPLVHIQNFNPAHDVIDIVSDLPGLGTTAITSGPNENVFTLTNDAAAQNYAGANAAILVVGSGSNADVYYYTPHDANFGNQAHAYQIAEVAHTSAADAAGKVAFVHLPSAV